MARQSSNAKDELDQDAERFVQKYGVQAAKDLAYVLDHKGRVSEADALNDAARRGETK